MLHCWAGLSHEQISLTPEVLISHYQQTSKQFSLQLPLNDTPRLFRRHIELREYPSYRHRVYHFCGCAYELIWLYIIIWLCYFLVWGSGSPLDKSLIFLRKTGIALRLITDTKHRNFKTIIVVCLSVWLSIHPIINFLRNYEKCTGQIWIKFGNRLKSEKTFRIYFIPK